MLTNHNYQPIPPDWDKETVLDCCTKQTTEDPCTDCCYDTWQNELKVVTQKYNSANETAAQLQKMLAFVTDRRNKYRKWLDELNNAQDLAVEICNQLELIALQSDKIWYNSCKAVDAIEILFCMIRDFFMQIDLIKTQYDDLQNCITNNTDPSLVRGQGILKSLDDYKAKLDVVIKLKDDIIKNIIAAIKIANLIRNSISTKECPDEDHKYDPCADNPTPCAGDDNSYYGFKTVICEWYNAFKCDVDCVDTGTGDTNTEAKGQQKQYDTNVIQSDCGDDSCELVPTFDFPICNNSYKKCVQDWLSADESKYTELTDLLQKANKKKEALTACKTSLDKAIKAVDPKERCK